MPGKAKSQLAITTDSCQTVTVIQLLNDKFLPQDLYLTYNHTISIFKQIDLYCHSNSEPWSPHA